MNSEILKWSWSYFNSKMRTVSAEYHLVCDISENLNVLKVIFINLFIIFIIRYSLVSFMSKCEATGRLDWITFLSIRWTELFKIFWILLLFFCSVPDTFTGTFKKFSFWWEITCSYCLNHHQWFRSCSWFYCYWERRVSSFWFHFNHLSQCFFYLN